MLLNDPKVLRGAAAPFPGRARSAVRVGAVGVLTATGLLLSGAGAAQAAQKAPGPVTGQVRSGAKPAVNAFTRPGRGGVVAKLRRGTVVRIRCQTSGPAASGPLGRSKIWDQIRVKGRLAYVSDASVFTGSDALVASACGVRQSVGRTKPGRVGTERLPLVVRRGPNTASVEVSRLAPGTRVRISCQTPGPAVAGTYGTSTLWNRITAPVAGFIPDSYTYTGSDGRVAKDCKRRTPTPEQPDTEDQGSPDGDGPQPGQALQGRCTEDVPFALEPATPNATAFVNTFNGAASQSDRKTNVPASVILGQGIQESGAGRSTAGANNYFGIKAPKQSNGLYRWGDEAVGCVFRRTNEVVDGKTVSVIAAFRLYRSAKDSFVDHGEFLSESSRYRPAFAAQNDSKEFIRRVARAGYATDPNYATSVISLMDQYSLYRFDVR
jgi:flagellum-specific peptidoglycan hydrolase FlgJ